MNPQNHTEDSSVLKYRTMTRTAGRGVRYSVETPAIIIGRCPCLALTKYIRDVVNRFPFIPPKHDIATNTGMSHAAGPYSLLANVYSKIFRQLQTFNYIQH